MYVYVYERVYVTQLVERAMQAPSSSQFMCTGR